MPLIHPIARIDAAVLFVRWNLTLYHGMISGIPGDEKPDSVISRKKDIITALFFPRAPLFAAQRREKGKREGRKKRSEYIRAVVCAVAVFKHIDANGSFASTPRVCFTVASSSLATCANVE